MIIIKFCSMTSDDLMILEKKLTTNKLGYRSTKFATLDYCSKKKLQNIFSP